MKSTAVKKFENSADLTQSMKAIAVAVFSFILGSAKIFGAISPFSIAFVSSIPIKYLLTTSVGSIIGTFLFAPKQYTWYYVISLIIITLMRFFIHKTTKKKPVPILISFITFGIMSLCLLVYSLTSSVSYITFILMCIEVLLCGCFSYFFSISSECLLFKEFDTSFSYIEISSIAIFLISVLISFSNFTLFNINIGVIIGVLIIYIMMFKFGIIGASVSSILVAIALNIASIDMLNFALMLIISSFIAGIFSPLKKFGQMSVFIAVATFSIFILGSPVQLSYRLIEIFFATAIFAILPERMMNIINIKSSASSLLSTKSATENISTRLSFASAALKDLQTDLNTVSKKFNDIDYNNISSIYDSAANNVCKGCSRALVCWDDDYNYTVDSLKSINNELKITGEIKKENMPAYFKDKCCKLDKFCEAINYYYNGFISKQSLKRQVSESRKIVFEQINSVADMLCEVSQEVSAISGYDDKISRQVLAAFNKIEENADEVVCVIDRLGRCQVDIYTTNTLRTSSTKLCEVISTAADKLFDLPSITTVSNKTRISFFEKASYSVDFCGQQSCFKDNTICGDSYEYFMDAKGYVYILLSDGMGSGKRAAIDSVMTCSIMLKLLKAGFGIDSAVRMLNSSLLIKSEDESLSTIDLAILDLYTGKVQFLKAGAATSFLMTKGEVKRFNSQSLPVGIIEEVELERKYETLREGDIVVLVSDGAIANGESFIVDEIKKNSNKSAKELSAILCNEAKRRVENEHQDDITILVAKLTKGI